MLGSEHEGDRTEAAEWLLHHRDESRPMLRASAQRDKEPARTASIRLLGKIGSQEDVDFLARLLEEERGGVQWEAAQALREHGSSLAVEALVRAANSIDAQTIEAAAVALGGVESARARATLLQLLSHPAVDVRYRAVYALGHQGIEGSRGALNQHLSKEEDTEVRSLIKQLLAGHA